MKFLLLNNQNNKKELSLSKETYNSNLNILKDSSTLKEKKIMSHMNINEHSLSQNYQISTNKKYILSNSIGMNLTNKTSHSNNTNTNTNTNNYNSSSASNVISFKLFFRRE